MVLEVCVFLCVCRSMIVRWVWGEPRAYGLLCVRSSRTASFPFGSSGSNTHRTCTHDRLGHCVLNGYVICLLSHMSSSDSVYYLLYNYYIQLIVNRKDDEWVVRWVCLLKSVLENWMETQFPRVFSSSWVEMMMVVWIWLMSDYRLAVSVLVCVCIYFIFRKVYTPYTQIFDIYIYLCMYIYKLCVCLLSGCQCVNVVCVHIFRYIRFYYL